MPEAMTLARLVRLQVDLEYRLDAQGRLVPIEGSDERSHCALYFDGTEAIRYVRFDLPEPVRERVAGLDPSAVLAAPETLAAAVGEGTAARYETYVARSPLRVEGARDLRRAGSTIVLETTDGIAASRAWSVRESDRAAECAVETAEPFRRRGLARQVVAAWANAMLAAQKVPFYSHHEANEASRALASTLGLQHVFTVVSVAPPATQ